MMIILIFSLYPCIVVIEYKATAKRVRDPLMNDKTFIYMCLECFFNKHKKQVEKKTVE